LVVPLVAGTTTQNCLAAQQEPQACGGHTDASGVGRIIAACIKTSGGWKYCRMQVPDYLWDQWLDRGDHNIQLQELLAVYLLIGSYPNELCGCNLSVFIGGASVMHGVTRCRARAAEQNITIARLWLRFAELHINLQCWQIEPLANLADGHTRHFLDSLNLLGAVETNAVLHCWLLDLWKPVVAENL
jgi:hypothetical protein